ncbi:SPOR domain-containing protein [Pseudomonas indica]|jgi:cell division protein FtsN|uniref:Cell division protein FtsN n=1 Tax=Pseudomonas indica TaxID=137658 RepID=A0A1G8SSZ4_9PSED|nr:SPOR domain-containing protein [Pseudomonas indica]PAU53028.1 cell division protein [Pseudomonas indica]SDJ32366.1 Cell division protein FtsN [Pseudomonas indica]
MAKKKAAPKRGASRYQAPKNKPVPGWVWMVCGLAIGGFLVFLMKLEPGRNEVKRPKPEQARPGTTSQPAKTPQPAQPEKPKYDFYTLLPESEVIVQPEALPEPTPAPTPPPTQPPVKLTPEQEAAKAEALLNGKTPPPIPTPTPPPTVAKAPVTQFFLQAGSFRRKDDAEAVRAQIILLGQNVKVESGTVRDETWHRVMVGPFANREQLNSAQKELSANGFSNLLLQQRQVR